MDILGLILPNWVPWVMIAVSVAIFMGLFKLGKKRYKPVATGLLIGAVVMIVISGGLGNIGFTPQVVVQGQSTGTSNGVSLVAKPIQYLNAIFSEKYSNSYSAVAGTLYVYPSGTDPKDPNANAITSLTIAGGNGSKTNPLLTTETNYRVVLGASDSHYSMDFGEMKFGGAGYDTNTGLLLFSASNVIANGTISDPLDESAIGGDINGVTSLSGLNDTGAEVFAGSTACAVAGAVNGNDICYNETTGDASFYIKFNIECTGANKECEDVVLCVDYDSTNPPEGNEYSSISLQLESGTDFGLPSDFTNYFKNEGCYNMGNIQGGKSGKYKMTFGATDANIDTNDDWSLVIDDLASVNGKDILSATKITKQTILFDATA